MLNYTDFLYNEERRKDLLKEARNIRRVQMFMKEKRKKAAETVQDEITDYMKTGLAAIFHR